MNTALIRRKSKVAPYLDRLAGMPSCNSPPVPASLALTHACLPYPQHFIGIVKFPESELLLECRFLLVFISSFYKTEVISHNHMICMGAFRLVFILCSYLFSSRNLLVSTIITFSSFICVCSEHPQTHKHALILTGIHTHTQGGKEKEGGRG